MSEAKSIWSEAHEHFEQRHQAVMAQLQAIGESALVILAERDALRREVEVLRQYGNKDCTAMADAALRGERFVRDGTVP